MAHRAEREEPPRTRVAVIGTLAEFHRDPVPYDLAGLVRLVRQQRPDLLCLDITSEQWTSGAFDDPPPEYRDALIPLADQTDIVVDAAAALYWLIAAVAGHDALGAWRPIPGASPRGSARPPGAIPDAASSSRSTCGTAIT